jgi:hypothetical protein
MTYGKMKQFRRDRLFANDRDRMGALTEILKKSRINDDQQNCHICLSNGYYNSPNRTGQGKGWDHGHTKGGSPQKVSPTKTAQGGSKNESTYSNNG